MEKHKWFVILLLWAGYSQGLSVILHLLGAHVLSMVWQSTEAMYVTATKDHINGETQMICDPFSLS